MKRYDSTEVFPRFDGKRVYKTTHYPEIHAQVSDTIVISNEGDYLDSLAYKYYGDPTLWWIIALANGLGKGRLSVTPGIQLRIPANINAILVEFHNINQ
jgi:nucleoid-associated protein YgaU